MKTKMMKVVHAVFLLMFFAGNILGQVSINADGSLPDGSAMLDVKSTTQGVLIPRMTQAQIEAVANPADGLIVYCTTDKKIYIFNGETSQWKEVAFGAGIIGPGGSGSCGQPVTDARDGKTYTTVQIGTQCWMAKYLNIGTRINASVNQANNSIIEKYCYDDNEANCAIYGGMYQWDEMMNYTASSSASPSGRQGICPAGWHIPSDDELNLLRTFAEGEYTAGGNLKEVGTSHWSEPNAGAVNSFGFTALPCGFRAPDGSFSSLSYYTNIQSATENSSTEIWTYGMHYDNTTVARSPNTKTWGTSVRCVKDPNSGIPTVTTSSVTNITETTATCGGNVTSEVGATVTARGVCWNTSSNPTISNTNTTDGSGTGTFVSNLTGLTLGTLYYIRAYATNGIGTAYGNEVSFTTVTSSGCGSSIAINHLVSGGVAPVNKTVTYGTVTNIPGEPSKCWITSNLGADYQATSVDDTTAASAGWYWQFNLKQGYQHDGTTRTPNTTWGDLIVENSDWQLANDPCILELGTGWRIPTFTEWNNVNSNGGWTNWNGPWNSGLKMHAAGALNWSDGSLSARGSLAYFWGSTQSGEANAGGLLFDSYAIWPIETFTKANGFPVRCIK